MAKLAPDVDIFEETLLTGSPRTPGNDNRRSEKGETLAEDASRPPPRSEETPFFPASHWMPKYSIATSLKGDISAGIGVGFLLIPQAIAYASIAQLPPQYGLWSAIFPALVYCFMAGTRHVSVGPVGALSILVGTAMKHSADGKDDVVSLITLIVGFYLMLAGIFRLDLIESLIITPPFVTGFVNAIVMTILAEQVPNLLGLPDHKDHSYQKLFSAIRDIPEHLNIATLVVSVVAIALLIGLKYLKKKVEARPATARRFFDSTIESLPETLVAVILAIVISWIYSLGERFNVSMIGSFSAALEAPRNVPFEAVDSHVFFETFVIAVVAVVEHVVAIRFISRRYDTSVFSTNTLPPVANSGQPNADPVPIVAIELFALGVANILGAFFRTIPVVGSTYRSALGAHFGSKSQFFSVIAAMVVLLASCFAGPLGEFLPRAVLASIIVVAASGIFEFQQMVDMLRSKDWTDRFIVGATISLCIIIGLETGLFIALGLSIAVALYQRFGPGSGRALVQPSLPLSPAKLASENKETV